MLTRLQRTTRVWIGAVALSFLTSATWSQQPRITRLDLNSIGITVVQTVARSISADGSVVVGYGRRSDGAFRSFVWTPNRGIELLPDWDYSPSTIAYAVSADGLTIVGASGQASPYAPSSAVQWTLPRGIEDLGRLQQAQGAKYALDVSSDGSVIVGGDRSPESILAFRWTKSGGMQNLGTLGGFSEATSVSADGSVIAGWFVNNDGKLRAFRWTEQTGITDLGSNIVGSQEQYQHFQAWGISPDGNVIVGFAYNEYRRAVGFRNVQQGSQRVNIFLGEPPSGCLALYPMAASRDGSVIVGYFLKQESGRTFYRAFRWTETGGIEDLNDTYADLLDEEKLLTAFDVTPDGRYIVGSLYNPTTDREEGFILDTGFCALPADVNDDGVVDDSDLLNVLFSFGTNCNR